MHKQAPMQEGGCRDTTHRREACQLRERVLCMLLVAVQDMEHCIRLRQRCRPLRSCSIALR
jgi:hypothetical protein